MTSLRIILLTLGFIVAIAIPIIAIVAIAYLIVPAKFTIWVLGGLASVILMGVIAVFLFVGSVGILGLNYKGKILDAKPETLSEDVHEFANFLKNNKFKLYTILEEKLLSQPAYRSLIFLHPSRKIVAGISHIDDDTDTSLSFATYWNDVQFVTTTASVNDDTDVIRKSGFIYSKCDGTLDEVYKLHLDNVKEIQTTAGKPISIQSRDTLLLLGQQTLKTYGSIIYNYYSRTIVPVSIGTAIPILAFGAIVVEIGLFFGLLPESDEIMSEMAIVLFVFISSLVFFVSPRLLPKQEKEKNKPKNDDILVSES